MIENKKALFISHDASRTGAPVLLINLASALKETANFQVDFLLLKEGELRPLFEAVGNTYMFWEFEDEKTKEDNAINPHFVASNICSYEFILMNTVIASYVIEIVRGLYNGPILSYIHELAAVNRCYTNDELWSKLIQHTNVFLAPAVAVKEYLVAECRVNETAVKILPYYVPGQITASKKPAAAFTIGGCGSTDVRKGVDLFIQTIRRFAGLHPQADVKFVWRGGDRNSIEVQLLLKELALFGLENIAVFESSSTDMASFYDRLSVFLLLSREDPYPVVVLEAASHKVPTICFKKGGGAPEFVSGAGKVVEFADVDGVVAGIYDYYSRREKLLDDSRASYEKVASLHQEPRQIVDILLDTVKAAQDSIVSSKPY